jgi:hypothetical protein
VIPLFVLPITLLLVLARSTRAIIFFVKLLRCEDHHPIKIGDERERLVAASPVMTMCWEHSWGNNYPENGLMKSPRCG